MTDRERWTIYPLLALSLGMQVRDKVLPVATVRAKTVHCGELLIEDANKQTRVKADAAGVLQLLGEDGKPKVTLGSAPNNAGVVQVLGDSGQVRTALMVDEDQDVGSISTLGADGHPRVLIAAAENGGVISTAGPGNHKLVELGIGKPWAGIVTPPVAQPDGEEPPAVADPAPQPVGGQLVLFSADGKPQWLMTHDERGSGRALAFDGEGRLYLVLMATLNVMHGPPGRKLPQPTPGDAAPPADVEAINEPNTEADSASNAAAMPDAESKPDSDVMPPGDPPATDTPPDEPAPPPAAAPKASEGRPDTPPSADVP